MLSNQTLTAISILNIISGMRIPTEQECPLPQDELSVLLEKLETAGVIQQIDGATPGMMSAYRLTGYSRDITLLHILEATGEHLDCNHPTRANMYEQYPSAATKLGVVNHMTRQFLSEISLNDF